MELRELVHHLLGHDPLAARQWVADAERAALVWRQVARPAGLDEISFALAASLAELLAERSGQPAPAWAAEVPAAPSTVYLVRAAELLPRLRALCNEHGPEPLRRRGFLAPPDFLTIA